MCFKKIKRNKSNSELENELIENINPINSKNNRDLDYTELVHAQANYSIKVCKLKYKFQILFSGFTFLFLIASSVLIVLFFINLSDFNLSKEGEIASIVASLVTYSASILGSLKIILEYIFNKNDDSNRNELLNIMTNLDVAKTKNSETFDPKIKELSDSMYGSNNNDKTSTCSDERKSNLIGNKK